MVHYDAASSSDPAGPSREDEHAPGFCGELFIITRDLFNALQLSGRLSDPESDEAFLALNEAGRFRLWGDGFDVLEGGLDELLDGSALRSAVVGQLVGIARKLRRYVDRDSELFRTLESMLEKAEYIYPEAIEAENEHWAELTLLETLEDVAILNDGLYELTPFLESIPIEYEENDELENSRQRTADPGQTTATKALHINILDKFPGAADNLPLVENLAERNMRRKERLWELKKKHESAPEPVSPSNGRGGRARSPSSYAPSTKYTMGTMRTFGSSVASVPYSLLDLQDDFAPSVASMSSFASADLDMVGITRIPPPPVRLGDGVSFECNLCFETLYGVETKYRWKKHVFKDLQPYSCSFVHCPLPATHLFNSRTEWVNHEFEVHRLLPSWTCITDCGKEFDNQEAFREHLKETHLGTATMENELDEIVNKCERRKPLPEGQTTVCPLCRETIPETKTSIRRHLGRHMEEISLAVVPTENYNLEWETSTEDESVSSSEEEHELNGKAEEKEEEEQDGELQRLRKEIEWRTVVPIGNKLLNCVLEIQASNRKLLHLHNEPRWRREVFELAQVYEAGREGGRNIMSDDIRRRTRENYEKEPSYARMKNQYGSPEEYDAYLDERLKGVFHQRQAFFGSFLEFRQCHLCKEVVLPDQSATRTDKCPQCQHHHCQACPRASVFPPSLRSQAEINLIAAFPVLQTRPPDPAAFTSSQPTPSIEAPKTPSQSSESPSGSRPSTPPAGRGRPQWRPLSEEIDPRRLSVDDGFQVVVNKKAGKQAARRTSASSYASSITGLDEATRTIQVDPKYYALLIGVGGGTLSDIITESGGPSLKAAQSRIVQFPKQDSASDRVVVRGPPQMVDAIVDRIKAKVEELEAWAARKDKPKVRFSLSTPEQKRPESSGSVWPATISVGRAHTRQKDINSGRRATEEEVQEALDKVGTNEPKPRTIKSAHRKHRKKKPNPDRRPSEVQV